jgi:hypothetical protein
MGGMLPLGMMALAIEYWKIALALLAGCLVLLLCWHRIKQKARERAEMADSIPKLWKRVKKHLEAVEHGKTLSTRQNNCSKAIALLHEMNSFGSRGKVARKTDDLLAKLTALEKTLPIGNFVEKAEKALFKKQRKQALNAYLDAIYECQKNNVTDRDFELSELVDAKSGEKIMPSYLKRRASDLGWVDDSCSRGE